MIHKVVHLNSADPEIAIGQALYAAVFAFLEGTPAKVKYVRMSPRTAKAIGGENLDTLQIKMNVIVVLNAGMPAGVLRFLDAEYHSLGTAGASLLPESSARSVSSKGGDA